MNIRDYEYIVTIADHGSITQTADQLFITQPALTKFLQRIEKALGLELFIRKGKQFILTEAGRKYVEVGHIILNLDRQLTAQLSQVAKSHNSRIRLGFSVDDFTGADYIILNHVHGDHSNLVGELWNKFYGRVLVPAECAVEVDKAFDIPYATIYPLYPGNTYHFDDYTLKTYPGARDNRAFREGRFQRPSDPRTLYDGIEGFGVPCPSMLGPLGSIYNLNFLIETRNNYKIDFSAGRDFEEHLEHVRTEKPNLMLRHRIRSYAPKKYADMVDQMGAQLIMPVHHNNARASGEDLNAYFRKVNEALIARNSPARAFNPEPYHWYTIQTSIIAD